MYSENQCMINTNNQGFNFNLIDNRRFMFNPGTGTLVLGKNGYTEKSHAQEFGELGCKESFDDFIRGWVGNGGDYPEGIIHFAPNIPSECVKFFDKAFDTLLMFEENGAKEGTVIRGFGSKWEQSMSDII